MGACLCGTPEGDDLEFQLKAHADEFTIKMSSPTIPVQAHTDCQRFRLTPNAQNKVNKYHQQLKNKEIDPFEFEARQVKVISQEREPLERACEEKAIQQFEMVQEIKKINEKLGISSSTAEDELMNNETEWLKLIRNDAATIFDEKMSDLKALNEQKWISFFRSPVHTAYKQNYSVIMSKYQECMTKIEGIQKKLEEISIVNPTRNTQHRMAMSKSNWKMILFEKDWQKKMEEMGDICKEIMQESELKLEKILISHGGGIGRRLLEDKQMKQDSGKHKAKPLKLMMVICLIIGCAQIL